MKLKAGKVKMDSDEIRERALAEARRNKVQSFTADDLLKIHKRIEALEGQLRTMTRLMRPALRAMVNFDAALHNMPLPINTEAEKVKRHGGRD